MAAEKISVIVPVYNSEEYLSDCIESILKQDYQNYEVILIDDGSTDSSGAICDEYSAKYKQIQSLHQQNKGVSAARNAGLKVANGRYITFVDSDDWIESDCLSTLEKHMKPGGMSICNLAKNTDGMKEFQNEIYLLDKVEVCALTTNPKGAYGRPWGRLFDKGLIDKYQLTFCEDIIIAEDSLFCVQYLSYTTEPIVCLQAERYHYRYNPRSATNSLYTKKQFGPSVFSACIALDREIECMCDYPELVHKFRMRQITEKRNALRIMVINDWKEKEIYKEYLHDIRKGVRTFLRCDIGQPFSEKVGVILACISPELEYFVWRIWKSSK